MQDQRIGLGRELLGPRKVRIEKGLQVFEGAEPLVTMAVGVPTIPIVSPAEGPVFLNRHGTCRTVPGKVGVGEAGRGMCKSGDGVDVLRRPGCWTQIINSGCQAQMAGC